MNNTTAPTSRDEYDAIARLYDWVVPYQQRPDVEFFVNLARDADGPVLEIGCGTGRVMIPTARQGVPITGLDNSPSMLDVCRQNLSEERPDVQQRVALMEGDMRNFSANSRYALVTFPFRPFQHLLTIEDQLHCLSMVYNHLSPGGRVVLDLFNPMLERIVDEGTPDEFDIEPSSTLPDGRTMVRKGRIRSRDMANQLLEIEMVHDVSDPNDLVETITERITIRYFFRYEIEHLLARCGFRVVAVYSDYEKRPFGEVYPGELIVVAERA